jgi:glucuronate isomerase
LDRLHCDGALPRTILYSIDPSDDTAIDTLVHCFSEPGIRGKVRHGAAWWFNDNKEGIRRHLASLAAQGLLGTFAGMLTDSRSLLSFVRHDYFRRILCDYLGELVEAGEYPKDPDLLEGLVKDISYRNCLSYFGFEIEE